MAPKNFGRDTVVAPPSPPSSGLSFTVAVGASRLGAGPVVLAPAGDDPTPDNAEVALIESVSGATVTLTSRAIEGSTARTVAAGWQVIQGVTAGMLANLLQLDPTDAGVWVGNVATGPPVDDSDAEPWLKIETPHSAGDDNADVFQILSETAGGVQFRTAWGNGNGEWRTAPSLPNRVGARFFEMQESVGGPSTGRFFELSTNPTNTSLREPLLGGYGTGHGSKPGWIEATRILSALQGLSAGGDYNSLTAVKFRGQSATTGAPTAGTWIAGDVIIDSAGALWLCTVGGTPGTWVGTGSAASAYSAVTPGTNMQAGAVAAATRLEPGGASARLRGTLAATGSVSANATLGTVTAAHRPQVALETGVRYSGGGSKLTISTGGLITIGAALSNGESVFLGSTTWDLAP